MFSFLTTNGRGPCGRLQRAVVAGWASPAAWWAIGPGVQRVAPSRLRAPRLFPLPASCARAAGNGLKGNPFCLKGSPLCLKGNPFITGARQTETWPACCACQILCPGQALPRPPPFPAPERASSRKRLPIGRAEGTRLEVRSAIRVTFDLAYIYIYIYM